MQGHTRCIITKAKAIGLTSIASLIHLRDSSYCYIKIQILLP